MKLIPVLSAFLLLTACNNKKEKKQGAAQTDSMAHTIAATNHSDTLIITKNAAVYYSPDSLHMEQWKKELGEEDFSTVADDWSYYMMISQEYLAKIALPVEDASGKKAVKFIKADNSTVIIRLDTLKSYWAAYLFTPAKDPVTADIVSMEESCKQYFEKK